MLHPLHGSAGVTFIDGRESVKASVGEMRSGASVEPLLPAGHWRQLKSMLAFVLMLLAGVIYKDKL